MILRISRGHTGRQVSFESIDKLVLWIMLAAFALRVVAPQIAPGRYLLEWEQDALDHAVTDAFGFHALQLGMPELDGLRANRMPHRCRQRLST
jgi:uncharacterized protein involved in response to NO